MIRITASQLRRLEEIGTRFDFTETPDSLHLDARDAEDRLVFQEPIVVKVDVEDVDDRRYYVKFSATAPAHFVCDRCLTDVRREMTAGYGIVFSLTGDADTGGADSAPEDFRFLKSDEDIVLDDAVREAVLLEIPNKILCSDECKGICPQCGADLNLNPCNCKEESTDPRWEKLAEIRKQLEG